MFMALAGSIIFTVLKVILILLLILILFTLLVTGIVLFSPLKYRICAEKYDVLKAEAKVSWLFGIIRILFNYNDGDSIYKIKIAGIDYNKLLNLFNRRKNKNKTGRQKKDKAEEDRQEADYELESTGYDKDLYGDGEEGIYEEEIYREGLYKKKLPEKKDTIREAGNKPGKEISRTEEKHTANKKVVKENKDSGGDSQNNKTVKKEENTGKDTAGAKTSTSSKKAQKGKTYNKKKASKEKVSIVLKKVKDKIKSVIIKLRSIPEKIKGFMEKIISFRETVEKGIDAFKDGKEKAFKVKEFIFSENTKGMVCVTKDNVLHLLKKIKPRKVKSDIVFGTGNPCQTGGIFGAVAVYMAVTGIKLDVKPDFENKVLKGRLEVSGHIHSISLIRTLLKILLSSEWKVFYKEAMKIKEEL